MSLSNNMRENCLQMLQEQLLAPKVLQESLYLQSRPSFERPYGLTWVLALAAEVRQIADPRQPEWSDALAPLEDAAWQNLKIWLPKLGSPIRTGTHNQTAFSLCQAWDWARSASHSPNLEFLENESVRLYGQDHDYPLHLEPSGEDFLSPSLGAASLMSRVLSSEDFDAWRKRALPDLQSVASLRPANVTDPTDGRLAHLDGLNLSRAWMIRDLMDKLPKDHPELELLRRCANEHRQTGLHARSLKHYSGAHWLGTFATYLLGRYPQ